jgi:hypothetical protein
MVGLLDIAPPCEAVEIGGNEIEVTGLSGIAIAQLLARYPDIAKLIEDGALPVERAIEMGGDIVSAIIAAGCGYPGDKKAEELAAKYSLHYQVEFLEAIKRATFPNGLGPFVAKFQKLAEGLDQPGEVVKLRLKPSPEPSKSSSPLDTLPIASGQ